MLQPTPRTFLRNWWPALAWVGVLFAESHDFASAKNTGSLLEKVLSLFVPHVDPVFVDHLNEVLRKTGHFIGYGILGVLVFLALRNTNRDRLRALIRPPWGSYLRDIWRLEWSFLGVMAAIGMATYDEIHQTFIPSRTGRWQDVVLDTCGAIVTQFIVYWFAMRRMKRGDKLASKPQLSATT